MRLRGESISNIPDVDMIPAVRRIIIGDNNQFQLSSRQLNMNHTCAVGFNRLCQIAFESKITVLLTLSPMKIVSDGINELFISCKGLAHDGKHVEVILRVTILYCYITWARMIHYFAWVLIQYTRYTHARTRTYAGRHIDSTTGRILVNQRQRVTYYIGHWKLRFP